MEKVTTRRRRKSETPEQRKRKQAIQIILGLVVVAVLFVLASIAQAVNPNGAYLVMIGTAFGYILQRSRFCFTAASRDPLLTGTTDLTKAVIISFVVSSILFMGLNMAKFGYDVSSVDYKAVVGNVKDVGLHTLVGGIIFGIGAVLAGGCASGTLMRMGEGFMQQWLSFVFFVIGSVLGLWVMKYYTATSFYTPNKVFLPEVLGGWTGAIVVQFGALFALYILADWWGKKKAGEK